MTHPTSGAGKMKRTAQKIKKQHGIRESKRVLKGRIRWDKGTPA